MNRNTPILLIASILFLGGAIAIQQFIPSPSSPETMVRITQISDLFESDSEYEFEEIVELCEWYPPDFWKSKSKSANKVRLTDVTVNDLTVTMRESKSSGFFAR